MNYRQLAAATAQTIAARVTSGPEARRWDGRLSICLPDDNAGLAGFIDEVVAKSPRGFCELPIPASAQGAIGRHEGVIVRVMQDYDFHADRQATRIDVAFYLT